MKDTVKIMTESAFGFDTNIMGKNRELFESTAMVSEEVRQLTGFTPDKVVVLKKDNDVFIEFAGNLERLMKDAGYDVKEAIQSVMIENKQMATTPNIIVDESCVDTVNMEALIGIVGADHVLRK